MSDWVGIVLSGGTGSRLSPLTKGISKQLLPIYDKPMIYYPISVLMLADIRNILIITTPEDSYNFKRLLGNGNDFGINISYAEQPNPDGLAQAFLIGEKFIGDKKVCLILGDNIFYGQGFSKLLLNSKNKKGATIFGYKVSDPERFGVVEFDKDFKVQTIQEKPKIAKSNYAVTGLYFYENSVVKIAKEIKASERGELEITSINNIFLQKGCLNIEILGRGFAWLDTGTNESLLSASQFVETIETRQSYKIACLEEIAFNKGWISSNDMKSLAEKYRNNGYGRYLLNILHEKKS